MSDNAHNPHPQPPVMIEEEPPHEFYANLLGNTVLKSTSLSGEAQSSQAKRLRDRSHSSSSLTDVAVIPNDYTNTPKEETSFARVYKRALSDPPKLTSLAIDQSNRGYQLLEKMGWNEQSGGLGRERQGAMLPVKTVLKKDKKGLGCGKPKEARITHTKASESKASQDPPTETKAQRRQRRKREAEKQSYREKRIRMLLRSDISDEYEKLYMNLHR